MEEAWEYEDKFPINLVLDPKSDIRHITHLADEMSVDTWVMGNGLIVNFLVGRFGSSFKDIKAKWGYSSVEEASADARSLLT